MLHRAVELVSVQDARRPIWEPELFVIGRGIELLAKTAWVLNGRVIAGEFRSATKFNHRLAELLESVEDQASALGQPSVLSNPVLGLIVEVVEEFVSGGRYGAVDGSTTGRSPSPYLWWNSVQVETVRMAGRSMKDAERYEFLRTKHTERSRSWSVP